MTGLAPLQDLDSAMGDQQMLRFRRLLKLSTSSLPLDNRDEQNEQLTVITLLRVMPWPYCRGGGGGGGGGGEVADIKSNNPHLTNGQ